MINKKKLNSGSFFEGEMEVVYGVLFGFFDELLGLLQEAKNWVFMEDSIRAGTHDFTMASRKAEEAGLCFNIFSFLY